MSKPLRVLLIEDSDDDAELLLHELRRGGYAPEWQRVDTAPALDAALAAQEWDLVTCDYVMPQFGALAALRHIRDSGIDVPVIIVSGQVGEEVAVAAMKAGAHDYISKHRMTRLVPAIERELEEARERTARRRAEATLLESERRYRELVESLHEVVFEVGADQRFTYVSPSLSGLGNMTPESLIGRPFHEVVHPDDLPRVLDSLRRTLEGAYEPLIFRAVEPNGTIHWVRTASRPVFAADGTFVALRGVLIDVTEQIEAEEAYRTVFEHSPHGLAVLQGEYVALANPALSAIKGLPLDELLATPMATLNAELVHPDDLARMQAETQRFVDGTVEPGGYELRMLRRGGGVRQVITAHTPMRYRGRPAWLVSYVDVTERTQAEEAYRTIFECSVNGLAVVQGDRIRLANPAFVAITGRDLAFLTATPLDRLTEVLVHPDDLVEQRRRTQRYLGGVDNDEPNAFRILRPDGSVRHVVSLRAGFPYHDAPARLVTFIDDTERAQAEAALRDLNAALEARVAERTAALQATAQELEAFSYSASHDLRAPLRSIDGLCQAVIEDYAAHLPADAGALLQRVRAATASMGTLIDQLMTLSRVVRGELRRQPVDLSTLAREVAAELARGERGRTVTISIADGLAANGDAALLRAVFANLLGNAWKFTQPRAEARVSVGALPHDGRDAFYVRDNGVGFDPTQADRLFRPFQRLHPASEFAGHGIGLATVLRIVTRHGGRAWAESSPGHGATFYFTLD